MISSTIHRTSRQHIVRLDKLYKPIIRNRIGKKRDYIYLNVVDVKTLHGPISTVVKQNHNGDYLTDAHFGWFLGRVAQQGRVEGSFEAVAKVINGTEYFSGFIVGRFM